MKQMQWINEPEKWQCNDQSLKMQVTAKTDFWRKTHYGFTVDDGPFYYAQMGGEFEVEVKITGQYKTRYDQMGLMIRKDEQTWIKTGIEYVDNQLNLSAVVTHETSDWNMLPLSTNPGSVWLKVLRRLDAVHISYSLDGEDYTLMRLAYFPDNTPVKVGLMAASPDGDGFEALFEDFKITHLPDQHRTGWLSKNT